MLGLSIGDFQHLMRYPLAPFEPTPLTLHRNNVADLSGNVTWRALEIGNAPDMQIRQGESLLLTAGMLGETGMLQIVVLDSSNQVFSTCTGISGETFPVLFDRDGIFNAFATFNDVSIGSLLVSVAHVDLQGPIACQIGYRREKEVFIYGPTNDIFFTSSDIKTMTVTNKVQTERGMRLYLKALKAGKPMLQARLGSTTGPIIAQQVVDVFSISVSGGDIIDMDTSEAVFHLVMTPYVPGLDFNTSMFSHHSTFADGTTTYEFHSSDFTVFTNGTNGVCGSYDLKVYVPEDEESSCFSETTSQALEKIGYLQANRSGCWFRVPIKYAVIGQDVTMNLELAAENARNHPPLGSHGPHALEIRNSDNPSISISVTPNSASCADYPFEMPIAFTANDNSGWYDVLINSTPFSKKICVIKVESLLPSRGEEVDDFDDNSDTKTFVLRRTPGTLTVTAVPSPSVSEANLPTRWTLTGGEGRSRLTRTLATSTKGTYVFQCTAGTSSKTLTIKIVDLAISFMPDDNFEGRSYTRLGIGETGLLVVDTDPYVRIADAYWNLLSGDASLRDIGDFAELTGGTGNANLSIEVMILSDPFFGETLTTTLEQTKPTQTIFVRRGTAKGHLMGGASAAFQADYYIAPLNVSFWKCIFGEGTVAPIGAWGICSAPGMHRPHPYVSVVGGNILTGCRALGVDTPKVSRPPPFESGGGFTWVIPAKVRVATATGDGDTVDTKSHTVAITSSGQTTLSKGSVSVTIEADAATENPEWFPPVPPAP